jgi:hypothetical protein
MRIEVYSFFGMVEEPRPCRKFEPLAGTLKDRFILFCILISILLIIDWTSGSPAMSHIIRLQFQWKGVDPEQQSFVISSFFGRFESILSLARASDKAGAIFFSVISGFCLVRGFLRSVFNEPTA